MRRAPKCSIDLGLPPTIAVGQAFPQHQIKGINDYRKTISIETEVSAAHAQDLGKVLGLSSSKAAKLVLPEKNLANIRAYRDASDPSFDDFKKALGDIKEMLHHADELRQSAGRRRASTTSRSWCTASSTS